MRQIDADAFAIHVALYMAENAYLNDTALDVLKKIAKWLDEEPTIDLTPVVHGEWRQHKLSVPKGRGQTYSVYGCSLCHKHERKRSDYCPNCGAKMKTWKSNG